MPEFNGYLEYFFEEKESNVIGSCTRDDCVLAIDLAKCKVFYPTRIENQQTNVFALLTGAKCMGYDFFLRKCTGLDDYYSTFSYL